MIRIVDEMVKGTGLSQKGKFVCQFQLFPLKVAMRKPSSTRIKNKIKWLHAPHLDKPKLPEAAIQKRFEEILTIPS